MVNKPLEKYNQRSQSQLITQIKMRSHDIPNFCLLLGAGSSNSCGVKTAKEMMVELAKILYYQESRTESFETWERNQDWFDNDKKYSILFERVYDQKPQRRNYIEQCVKNARPSWGHIYLSNIIERKYFDVILTTNFDDLLNESSILYSNFRPIVCAHDSTISGIRITSARPKIIKLHGDYLYDNIKNTLKETRNLEKNTSEKIMQFAKEYGLIVIGYGGNDNSVMDILFRMVNENCNYFPHGLYWCLRNEDRISKKVQKLLTQENTYWVKIEGFDDFMAELHENLGLSLPRAITNPYEATTEWLNNFISPKTSFNNKNIKKNIKEIQNKIEDFERRILSSSPAGEFDPLVPYEFLGNLSCFRFDFKLAIEYYSKEMKQKENNTKIIEKILICNICLEKFDDALNQVEKLRVLVPEKFDYIRYKTIILQLQSNLDGSEIFLRKTTIYEKLSTEEKISFHLTLANIFLKKCEFDEVLKQTENILMIDPRNDGGKLLQCIALKRKNKPVITILKNLIKKSMNHYFQACAYATLENKEKMLNELAKAIEGEYMYRVQAKIDSSFDPYQLDKDFIKLVTFEKSN